MSCSWLSTKLFIIATAFTWKVFKYWCFSSTSLTHIPYLPHPLFHFTHFIHFTHFTHFTHLIHLSFLSRLTHLIHLIHLIFHNITSPTHVTSLTSLLLSSYPLYSPPSLYQPRLSTSLTLAPTFTSSLYLLDCITIELRPHIHTLY